ncbi:MAG: cation-translocating P-type ATPase, partial [archaeon]|nr:cation-translocating P-type ATPase [archaeon]
ENAGSVKKKKNIDTKLHEDHNTIFTNEKYWEVLKQAIALNVDCSIKKLNQPDENGETEICEAKNKTDKGFIDFLYHFRTLVSTEKEEFLPDQESYKRFPFDSKRKRMTTFVKNSKFPTGYRLFTKGGAENAMIFSERYIDKEKGEIGILEDENRKCIDEMNRRMMRSLYICYKDITEEEYNNCDIPDNEGLLIDQKDLIFIGVFVLKDSLRNHVKESVIKCHQAGVKVIMVTGDNIVTATAIAKECNILPPEIDLDNLRDSDIEKNPNDINIPEKKDEHIYKLLSQPPTAITGNSFYSIIGGVYCEVCGKDYIECQCPRTEIEARQVSRFSRTEVKKVKKDVIRNMKNFTTIVQRLKVMARSQPIHKYALVLGLKELNNVVAVTGDGTNDAPALSKSDVGFAMFDGTDIAKEASDIIILDNNFSSIVVAIIFGRSIYENIRKFLQFQLTVNFCACLLVFICSCIGNETPLTSIQMLWVNLIMDSLGSLALATEPPYDELLNRSPTSKTESIINSRMWKHISLQSIFEIVLLFLLYLYAPKYLPEDKNDILLSQRDLYYCFGELPGGLIYNETLKSQNILYGNKNKWAKVNITLNQEVFDKYKCGRFTPNNKMISEKNLVYTLNDAYSSYEGQFGGTTHMTLIFNTFVFYTLFNQLNCRIIDDSLNIFKRINKAILFIIVTLCEMGIQAVLVEFGRNIFHCVNGGLSLIQWGYCLA